MNVWECEHPGCTSKAVGTGGAIGLHAIGWYFTAGSVHGNYESLLFCPAHRPDPIPCTEESENKGNPCSACAADSAVKPIQLALRHGMDHIHAAAAAAVLAGHTW